MGTIGVIGAGSWGTTLADLLARKGHDTTLWAYEAELVKEMEETRINSVFLPDITLSPRLRFTNSLRDAASEKEIVLFVAPTQVFRGVMKGSQPLPGRRYPAGERREGVELDTSMTISQISADLLPPVYLKISASVSFGPQLRA